MSPVFNSNSLKKAYFTPVEFQLQRVIDDSYCTRREEKKT